MSNPPAPTMTICLPETLPPEQQFLPGIRRAPDRGFRLTRSQTAVALKNALRYIPATLHDALIPEFLEELRTRAGFMATAFVPRGISRQSPFMNTRERVWPAKQFR